MTLTQITNKIEKAMKKKGVDYKGLSEGAGVKYRTIEKVKAGNIIGRISYTKIAKFLDIEITVTYPVKK